MRPLPGPRPATRHHQFGGAQAIAAVIHRRRHVGSYQWRVKHVRWWLEHATRNLNAATRYRYWLTIRVLMIALAKYVFTFRRKPITRLNNTPWRRARVRAGLPHLHVLDARHTFGHRLRAAAVNIEDRTAPLGHKVELITTNYSAPDLAYLLDCGNRFATRNAALCCEFVCKIVAKMVVECAASLLPP